MDEPANEFTVMAQGGRGERMNQGTDPAIQPSSSVSSISSTFTLPSTVTRPLCFHPAAATTTTSPARLQASRISAALAERWSNEPSTTMSSPAHSEGFDRVRSASFNTNGRRSFTLPPRITDKPASSSSSDGIETLFTHSSTKIISFTVISHSRRTSPSRRSRTQPERVTQDPISWTSPTERTLAVGVLRVYRVTSSNVSFLNSGNLLHTIFPKSQCWCVDGESIFVLRIRQDSYYRIELPYKTDEDKEKIGDFKTVLGQVLQYERTPCPFRREFEVEISVPSRPKTPPRRRSVRPAERAKKWTFDKTWVPDDGKRPSTRGSDTCTVSSYDEDDRSSVNTDTIETIPDSPGTLLDITPPRPVPPPSVLERTKAFQGLRSVTVPSSLKLAALSSLDEYGHQVAAGQKEQDKTPQAATPNETLSLTSSVDSFHSLESLSRDSPSPPYLDAEAELINPWAGGQKVEPEEPRGRGRHRRQISEVTVRASSSDGVLQSPRAPTFNIHPSSPIAEIPLGSPPSTPPLVSDSDEDSLEPPLLDAPTPPSTIRMKRLTGATQRRAFSPMPPPQNLFRPTARGPGPAKALTAALVRKTYELILGPPAHLVSLMLQIASRVSNGAFGWDTYKIKNTAEKIPCAWESSEDEWDEDDYGIPLGNMEESTLRRRHAPRGAD